MKKLRYLKTVSGGTEVQTGSVLDVKDNEGLKIAGTPITSTASELNTLDGIAATVDELNTVVDETLVATDGLQRLHLARATYDFSVDGGAQAAHGLGVTLPDNAVICGGFIDVSTTLTSADDSATIAVHILTANDIVNAVSIVAGGTNWDAGIRAIIPKANTPESTGIKLTSAKEITATIAVQNVTAGKFVVNLFYTVGD